MLAWCSVQASASSLTRNEAARRCLVADAPRHDRLVQRHRSPLSGLQCRLGPAVGRPRGACLLPAAVAAPSRSRQAGKADPSQQDLQQEPTRPGQGTASTAPGTLFGAISLIVGSTVGAGMLALPSVTAPAGFGPTATLLVGLWGLLTAEALLIAEVNLNVGEALKQQAAAAAGLDAGDSSAEGAAAGGQPRIVTLRQMAEYTLGEAGKGITVVYLGLAYTLLVAYISKAAEVLDFFAGGSLTPAVAAAVFVGGLASMLFVGGAGAADKVNQWLTSMLLGLFLLILASGAVQTDWTAAVAGATSDWGAAAAALPIIFLALVYHDLVPVICAFLGGDRRAIRTAIVFGSMIPLCMFLSWEAVSLSLVPAGLLSPAAPAASLLPDPGSSGYIMEAAFRPEGSTAAAAAAAATASWDMLGAGPASAAVLDAAAAFDAAVGMGGAQLGDAAAEAAAVAAAAAAAAQDLGPAGLQDVVVPLDSVPVSPVAGGMTVDPLQVLVRRSPPLVGAAVQGFSFLAVLTSCIGTSLSLSETLRTEVPPLVHQLALRLGLEEGSLSGSGTSSSSNGDSSCDIASQAPAQQRQLGSCSGTQLEGGCPAPAQPQPAERRGLALALTLGPPLLFTLSRPDAFLGMLEAAGAYGMTLLYGVVPPVMAWQLRRLQASSSPPAAPPSPAAQPVAAPWWEAQLGEASGAFVPGGTPVLAGMLAVALVIGAGRISSDLGVELDLGGVTSQLVSLAGAAVPAAGHAAAGSGAGAATLVGATLL